MRRGSFGLWSCILCLFYLAACTQYKPSSYRSQVGNTGTATGNTANGSTAAKTDVSMTLANTKLTPVGGTLTAKITFNGLTVNQDFAPTGTQSTLAGLKLPQGANGVLTVEIYQGDAIKFVAKRANTSLVAGNNNVVVDDCLILRAPWVGTVNEGSCEWNITEN